VCVCVCVRAGVSLTHAIGKGSGLVLYMLPYKELRKDMHVRYGNKQRLMCRKHSVTSKLTHLRSVFQGWWVGCDLAVCCEVIGHNSAVKQLYLHCVVFIYGEVYICTKKVL
jgi:hypothetical protein